MSAKIATTVYLTAHQLAQLQVLSARHGRAVASLVREGIDLALADLGGVVEGEPEEAAAPRATMAQRLADVEARLAKVEAGGGA